jgi:uncharacterized membrane protein YhdT
MFVCRSLLEKETERLMLTLALTLLAQTSSVPRFAASSAIVFLALLLVGVLGWLVAAVLGFARARVFGSAVRWFALSAVCLLLFHLHIIAFALYGSRETDVERLLSLGAFITLFVALGAVCAIIGFTQLNRPPR